MHLYLDEQSGVTYQVHPGGSMTPYQGPRNGVGTLTATGLPGGAAPVATPGVCNCAVANFPHKPCKRCVGRVAHDLSGGTAPHTEALVQQMRGEMVEFRQQILDALAPTLAIAARGQANCDVREPLSVPVGRDGCAKETVKCGESLPFVIRVPAASTIIVPITPYESFQPRILLHDPNPFIRWGRVEIKGNNQLGSNAVFNPNNYNSLGNYNDINWEEIHAAIPVFFTVINSDPIAVQISAGEVKGSSIR